MSTKRLSRTVLEGGRTRYEKRMRHLEQKAERARMRNYLANVKRDLEYADEYNCPIRRRIFEGFTDKLKPVYRYIDSKVGQRWDDVWSELSERFDLRSLSGYHICYQHVVPEVFPDPLRFFWHKPKWYVEDGILLANKYSKPSPEDIKEKTEELKTVVEWLEGHKIGFVDGVLYWFRTHYNNTKVVVYMPQFYQTSTYPRLEFRTQRLLAWTLYNQVEAPYIPIRKLDKYECKFFFSLSSFARTEVLKHRPKNG